MAYKEMVGVARANTQVALEALWAQMVEMGWTLEDSIGYSGTCAPAGVDTTGETITIVGHTFVNGDQIYYESSGTVIGGLTARNYYFIVQVSGDTFKLSSTQGGGAINLTSQGTGTHYFREGYRVFSSNGEDASQIAQYLYIGRSGTQYQITMVVWYYWNPTTHVGYGQASGYPGWLTLNDTGITQWIYGDKDFVVHFAKVGTNYYAHFAGFVERFWTVETTLTSDAVAGGPVTLSVANSADFRVGRKYQIVGANHEGRDDLTVTAKGSGTLTVSTLPRNYGTGARIGMCPCPSGHGYFNYTSVYFSANNVPGAVGLTDVSNYYGLLVPFTSTMEDPDAFGEQKYLLMPMLVYSNQSGGSHGILGRTPDNFLCCATLNVNPEDTFGVDEQDFGTATSGTNNTLVDSSKSWTPDQFIPGKAVIIKTGTGAGQIRKITDNDGTSLTVSPNWVANPGADSTYVIVSEAYRVLAYAAGNPAYPQVMREGIA